MDGNSGMSPADLVALSNNGIGGGWEGLIYLAVIASMFGGGFGFGGWGNGGMAAGAIAGNMATQSDVQRGFDNQNLQAQTRDILTAVNAASAQGVAATNQVYHDVVGNLGDKYMELTRDIAGVASNVQAAAAADRECCCEIKQMIGQMNYESAMRDAATNMNFVKEIQGVKDLVQQNKIEALQSQVNQLQLAQATAGMLKFPNTWAYGAGPFPPIFGGAPVANI